MKNLIKKQTISSMALILFLVLIIPFTISCNEKKNAEEMEEIPIEEQVKAELKNTNKNDSLIIGLKLGMTSKQVDSVLRKAEKDSVIIHGKNDYYYSFADKEKNYIQKFTCTIYPKYEDENYLLTGIDLIFVEGGYDALKEMYKKKYGEVRGIYFLRDESIEVFLSKGRAIEFYKNKYSSSIFRVIYKSANSLNMVFEEIEEKKKKQMEKYKKEREENEKKAKNGLKSIESIKIYKG
jgi:hypothetical protein